MGDVEHCGSSDEVPVHPVTLDAFEMSRYEITNAQYAAYLNAALAAGAVSATDSLVTGVSGAHRGQVYLHLKGSKSFNLAYPYSRCWITYGDGAFWVEPGFERWPVVYVTWYGAKAFALHHGLDLPTEAEWEYASRGGRQFMYGTDDGTLSTAKANYNYLIHHPVEAGCYPANPYGLHDMSGNVWEWCHDCWGTYPGGSAANPRVPQSDPYRVTRGGSWRSFPNGGYYTTGPTACRSADRNPSFPADGYYDVGFRVVRRPGATAY
jgi:formylglycine-generating enzyme required for sulfatase activity